MAAYQKKYLPYILLLIFSIPLFYLNIYNVHAWGDDFAQYIKEAQNIAHGKPFYQSNYIFNKYNPVYAPPQYPPGFPLLLAPVVKFWGLSFTAMCYFNSVLVMGLMFALFAYFRKYTGIVAAICLSVLVCYSSMILDLKKNILADVPCLLFVTLYLWQRNAEHFSWRRIAAIVLFGVMAMQVRSQAVFLVAAEAGFLGLYFLKSCIKERKFAIKSVVAVPSLYIIGGVMLLNLLCNKVLFYSPLSATDFYNQFILDTLKFDLKGIAEQYMTYVFKTISAFFYYDATNGFIKAAVVFTTGMGLTFTVAGLVISLCRRLSVEDLFFMLMCVVILFYPVRDPRYFLPVIPVVFYYCYVAIKAILPAATNIPAPRVAVAITLAYLCTGLGYFKSAAKDITPGCIPQENDLTAIQYIKDHVNDTDIIIFTKPRMLTLFTNKRCMNVSWQMSPQMNKTIMDSMQVKYMLIVDGLDDDYFKTYLRETQRPIDSARISANYTLYTLR